MISRLTFLAPGRGRDSRLVLGLDDIKSGVLRCGVPTARRRASRRKLITSRTSSGAIFPREIFSCVCSQRDLPGLLGGSGLCDISGFVESADAAAATAAALVSNLRALGASCCALASVDVMTGADSATGTSMASTVAWREMLGLRRPAAMSAYENFSAVSRLFLRLSWS